MILPALCSVTFRSLSPVQIVALAAEADLRGIEWGGDLHVPPGNIEMAEAVRASTLNAGLAVAGYGSYYRVGDNIEASGAPGAPFEDVLTSAQALGAPFIRVWAGRQSSAQASGAYFGNVAVDLTRIAELAAEAQIAIVCEFHRNTVADTLKSSMDLLAWAGHPNLYLHWQPQTGSPVETGINELRAFAPVLSHIHIFQWQLLPKQPWSVSRHPLAEGATDWRTYLHEANVISQDQQRDIFAMLEFLPEESKDCFMTEAATLLGWIGEQGMGGRE
ncbi:MAG: sugar phosphate isomerase/epimerase [Chloroflexi bacterium]|nr:sugar phosphate isomerase/epimerase [Chloroflexota bacterium]